MAYATPSELAQRYGEQEIVRLTTPAGQDLGGIGMEAAETALTLASSLIDSYVRKRYRCPMDVPPDEIRRVCLDIARYELSTGDGKSPGDEVKERNRAAMAWLRDIADGRVVLELDEVATGDESYAQAETRRPVFGGTW